MIKLCAICDSEFEALRGQKTCSEKCSNELKKLRYKKQREYNDHGSLAATWGDQPGELVMGNMYNKKRRSEYNKKWSKENSEKRSEYRKEKRKENPEKYKKRFRKWYYENRENQLKRASDYRKNYPDKVRKTNTKSIKS